MGKLNRRQFLRESLTGAAASYLALAEGLRMAAAQTNASNVKFERPRLLVAPDDLSALRGKLTNEPFKEIYENYTSRARAGGDLDNADILTLLAVVTNEQAYKQKAATAFIKSWRTAHQTGKSVLRGEIRAVHQPRPGARSPRYDFASLRYIHRSLHLYDFIAAFGTLSEIEDKEFRADVFAAVERLLSTEIRAINARRDDRRHNFHTEVLTVVATAALAFPEHEKANEWLAHALSEIAWQMENGVEAGAWHETPTYHAAILRSLVPLAYALRRNGKTDLFQNAGFRTMLEWFADWTTPPDKVYASWLKAGGKMRGIGANDSLSVPEAMPLLPAIGDAQWTHYWFAIPGMAAAAYKTTDPKFAARLAWIWERAGRPLAPEIRQLFVPLMLADASVEAAPQTLSSVANLKTGYTILRGGGGNETDDEKEKWLFFNCGHRREDHWATHRHRDLNSFSLYADGVPLALDPGTGQYHTPEQGLWYRGTLSHNTVIFGDRDQDVEDGEIVQFISRPEADYVVGDASRASDASRVLQFTRHILFVKPDYYVVWDFIRANVPAEFVLHSPAQEIKSPGGGRLEFVTPWQMSLDAHFLSASELRGNFYEGRIGQWREGQSEAEKDFPFVVQKYVRLKNAPGKDFLTVLHPRQTSAAPLTVRKIGADEHFLEIKTEKRTDLILMFAAPREFEDRSRELNFKGSTAIIRTKNGKSNLVLLDGEELVFGRQTERKR